MSSLLVEGGLLHSGHGKISVPRRNFTARVTQQEVRRSRHKLLKRRIVCQHRLHLQLRVSRHLSNFLQLDCVAPEHSIMHLHEHRLSVHKELHNRQSILAGKLS